MDLYLLDERDVIAQEFTSMSRVNELNVLEKCLLIDTLVHSGKHLDFAKSLAERLQMNETKSKNSRKSDVEYENKVFDLVLNLNTLNDMKGDLE